MIGPDPYLLQRFIDAQAPVWDAVVSQLQAGRKTSHWMWFVFPQLRALGHSARAQFYGLSGHEEALAYLAHPLLGECLRAGTAMLASRAGELTPRQMLGAVDAQKLCSCLTLFGSLGGDDLFGQTLDALYGGEHDPRTLALLA